MFLEPQHHMSDQVGSVKRGCQAWGSSGHICLWNDGSLPPPGLVPFSFPGQFLPKSAWSPHTAHSPQWAVPILLPQSPPTCRHAVHISYRAQRAPCRVSQVPTRQVLLRSLHRWGNLAEKWSAVPEATQLIVIGSRI